MSNNQTNLPTLEETTANWYAKQWLRAGSTNEREQIVGEVKEYLEGRLQFGASTVNLATFVKRFNEDCGQILL